MNYYLCAYGGTTRWSVKVVSSDAAARDTFGISERSPIGNRISVTCLNAGGRSPRYMTHARKKELHNQLVTLHEKNTGNKLIGWL